MNILGVLISGGFPTTNLRKVELYNLITKTSCELPDLPTSRNQHISLGGVICGGRVATTQTSCNDITSGSWSTSRYESIRKRYLSVSWNINPGESFMILGGGGVNLRTTDIVHTNGTVEPGFNLQYDTL